MTEDQLYRTFAVGFALPIQAYLFQKAKAYLSARREQEGRGLLERLCYRLGESWASAYKRV